MARSRKTIRSQNAEIYGDNIYDEPVKTQTGNHETMAKTVDKHVTIEYDSPRPHKALRKLDEEPSKNSTKAKIATVHAKNIIGPWPSNKHRNGQKWIRAKRDVVISYLGDESPDTDEVDDTKCE